MDKSTRTAIRVSVLGLVANALLGVTKLTVGLLGNSFALVADAVESFSDIVCSTVVLGGLSIASRPPDKNHPYGHGKADALAALAVALLLIGAAIGIATHAVRVMSSSHGPPAAVTFWALLVIVVVKEGLYRYVRNVGAQAGSTAVQADAWHHRSDSLSSSAAAAGIAVALLGGPGYEVADEIAAIAVSIIIAANGVRFVRCAFRDLMDAEPIEDIAGQATLAARSVEGVRDVEKVFARKMGLRYLVDMHIEVAGTMSVRDAHHVAHQAKDRILLQCPRVADALIHIEPYPNHRDDATSSGGERSDQQCS